jgi:hypothetical protein
VSSQLCFRVGAGIRGPSGTRDLYVVAGGWGAPGCNVLDAAHFRSLSAGWGGLEATHPAWAAAKQN